MYQGYTFGGTAMKLSTFTDYSLRLLMYLAAEPQRRATIAEVAAAFDISAHHLTKVAHVLGRDGWLANVRGHGGGLALALPPRQIVIGAVVRRTERSDDDFVIEKDGATVVIDSISAEYLRGSQLDFVDDLMGQAFKMNNPNATATCGCGTSFAR